MSGFCLHSACISGLELETSARLRVVNTANKMSLRHQRFSKKFKLSYSDRMDSNHNLDHPCSAFYNKDLSLSCKAGRRALLPRPLRTDVQMRLTALQ